MASKGFEGFMRAAGKAVSRTMRDTPPADEPVSLAVALDRDELLALDAWIARQEDPKPSRPQAVRKLLAVALSEG